MHILDMIQGSDEWRAARAGSLGASQVADAIAKTKTGWGSSRANLRARLVAERLTGSPLDTFANDAMRWGVEHEADARTTYAFLEGQKVVEVGLVLHPTIKWTHASPDGLVGADGLVEIKCPNTATHIETLKGQSIPGKYVTQMMWQMNICERQWCDFVSYDPRLPEDLQLFVKRLHREDAVIADLEDQVRAFLAEVEEEIEELIKLYRKEAA